MDGRKNLDADPARTAAKPPPGDLATSQGVMCGAVPAPDGPAGTVAVGPVSGVGTIVGPMDGPLDEGGCVPVPALRDASGDPVGPSCGVGELTPQVGEAIEDGGDE